MEELVNGGECICVKCVWPDSALGTPRPWGRLWRDTDESPVFAPARRSYVLPHRLPPADSALWAGRLSLPWPGRGWGPAAGPWPPRQLAHRRPRTLCPGWGGECGSQGAWSARGYGSHKLTLTFPVCTKKRKEKGPHQQETSIRASCFSLQLLVAQNTSVT